MISCIAARSCPSPISPDYPTPTNALAWDVDDNTGGLGSNNVYRYSRNILVGVNAQWYLGRSGRNTDPFAESRAQRINELEFTLTYEI